MKGESDESRGVEGQREIRGGDSPAGHGSRAVASNPAAKVQAVDRREPRRSSREPEPDDESMDEGVMCSYTEYDPETGETYRCGLKAHTGKVKHTRGCRA